METPVRRRRVTKSAENRRGDILRAGEKIFRTIGFPEATIADITSAAEIAKGTFYLYFDTKDHLLAAVWESYVDGFLSTTQQILGSGGAWWPTLDELNATLIEHAVRNAELHRIVYGSANGKALELCKQSNQRVIDLICDYVGRGAEAGAFRGTDPDLTCRMLYHAVDGLLDELIARRAPLDTPHIVRCVLEMSHRSLGDPDHGR